jgi:hypothetical protein
MRRSYRGLPELFGGEARSTYHAPAPYPKVKTVA